MGEEFRGGGVKGYQISIKVRNEENVKQTTIAHISETRQYQNFKYIFGISSKFYI